MESFNLQQTFDRAVKDHQSGRLDEAEQAYRRILARHPDHYNAVHLLGVLAYQSGHYTQAVRLIRQALTLRPDWADAYFNLGKALKDNGETEQAIVAFRQGICFNPNDAEAHYALGSALQEQGANDQAAAEYGQAIALRPNYPEALNNLGNIFKKRGRLEESIAIFRRAIALMPEYAEAFHNLGNALSEVRQIEHAMIAYRQAIKLNPRLAETYSSLGIALKEAGRFDEAVAVLRQAIAIKPEYADAHVNLGGVLQDIGELDEAFAEHRHAVALAPNLVEAHSNLVCALQYHPGYDAAAIASEARAWNQRHAEPLRSCIRPHGNDRNPERRLRIGYVSPDFWDHVVGRNLLPLLANHDKKPFEIFAYSLVKIPDARTNQLRGFTDHWRSIVGMPDDQVADQIRADGIDILVDLALHTAKNRLLIFARKPAPVQVTFAGYPGSTGLTTMDYRLSDPYLDPPGSEFRSENGADQAIYSEQTVRLPDSFWCYDPVDDRDISVGALPAIETGAITFGCLNTFHKVSDPALTFWARIIAAVKGSRLLLMAPAGTARTRVVNLMSRQGLDPDRIEFVPRQSRRNYLETYHRIDIGLDTFPYNGHTTSLDSFWMGVPVVTLLGETVVSRAGWCQLSNLGLKELAGRSPDEFVRIAVELAGDLPRLKEIRATLRQRMEASPLMDAPRFARNIESAYRGMWREWCSKAQGVIPAG